jgi:hypothetical protein
LVSVFFSYSHHDEKLRDQIDKQLSILKRQGVVDVWHDRRIGAGQEFALEIDRHVESDDIILLLVSPDFLASDYCYNIEMRRAMERHEAGEAIVIPVILRACEWKEAPFGKLNATPPDGTPITQMPDPDEAMLKVAQAVRAAAKRLGEGTATPTPTPTLAPPKSTPSLGGSFAAAQAVMTPRSSNLVLAKSFTERDKDAFKLASFDYLAKYFENSLIELATRNEGIEQAFRRIDANRFSAVIYKNGSAVSRCTIFMGDRHFASGIAYSASEMAGSNSFNEMLTVEADDQTLYLSSMAMGMGRRDGAGKLTQEGAAEFYWGMLIQRLQQNR